MRDRQAPSSFAGSTRPIAAIEANLTTEEIPFPGRSRLQADPANSRPTGRHVWVSDPAAPARPLAGLLIDWRRDPDGWWGRVILSTSSLEGRATVTDTWLPAKRLRPARAARP